nr:uncharacterized protein LOC127336552 isoform X3 [Lolium perenne]
MPWQGGTPLVPIRSQCRAQMQLLWQRETSPKREMLHLLSLLHGARRTTPLEPKMTKRPSLVDSWTRMLSPTTSWTTSTTYMMLKIKSENPMNSVEDPHKSTDEGLDARMLGRTEGSSSSAQPMEIMGTHMDSVDASKRPADSTQPNEIANRKHMDSVDVMRLPMDICPEAMLEHTENLSDVTPLKDEKRRKTNLQHNKPKKANKMVIPQDYVCTSEDIDVVKLIMSAPKNTKFVDIGDALLSNNDLRCLTQDGMFLHDGVINAYIYCISDRGHLRDRAGGRVHLESTFVSSRLKRHGEREIDPSDHRRIVERMDKYLKNDMVFLPINVTASHWYVIVVNAKKCVIQVLDSLGAVVKRNDVTLTLRGLEKHLKIASQKKDFNIGEKWHDLNVTKWPVIEQFPEPMQTDGASCGLFMINFMEYWTGDMLTDHVIQEDMNEFRPKLAAILYDSELNKIKGSPIYAQSDKEENGSDSDIVVLPNPKRPYSSDVAEDDRVKEKRPILVHMMPTDPRMLVHELCKYIMSIQDAKLLEQEWVRSSKPYPIGLNLKKIQEILRVDRPMDNDCFNLGVRIVACDEILQMVETDVHYMDLRFCTAMVDSTRGHKWRVKPNIQSLATLFDSWPGTPYKISSRKLGTL